MGAVVGNADSSGLRLHCQTWVITGIEQRWYERLDQLTADVGCKRHLHFERTRSDAYRTGSFEDRTSGCVLERPRPAVLECLELSIVNLDCGGFVRQLQANPLYK